MLQSGNVILQFHKNLRERWFAKAGTGPLFRESAQILSFEKQGKSIFYFWPLTNCKMTSIFIQQLFRFK